MDWHLFSLTCSEVFQANFDSYTHVFSSEIQTNQLFIFDIVHGYCFHQCLVALHIHCCLVLQGSAEGELYIDDFHTFSYKEAKQFVHRHLSFSANTLSSRSVCSRFLYSSSWCSKFRSFLSFGPFFVFVSSEIWPQTPSFPLPPG